MAVGSFGVGGGSWGQSFRLLSVVSALIDVCTI